MPQAQAPPIARWRIAPTASPSATASAPNPDLVIAAHHELALELLPDHRQRFDTFVSDLVLSESAKGDP